jgi:hypothetical protein
VLKLADNLSLPLDAVTQTFAILAKRGVGKTHTATIMAEGMLNAGQPIVVYDPTSAWWGLKSSKDGKRPGFPVVIFGGEHADVPLEESAGSTIATVIVEKRIPAILDVGLLRKGARVRFMTEFCETLYHKNREALHFFADEAHTIAPQNIRAMPESARLLGAMEDIVLQGRRRGLGVTVISQRPALVNKNVTTQCEVLIAMQLTGAHDRKAIEEWVDAHGDDASKGKEMLSSLSSLQRGEAWVWSPGWLRKLVRTTFRDRETFDSSATPKVGGRLVTPKSVAAVDLNALGEQIKATVEKAKADDPKELRRQIAELQRQVNSKPAAVVDENLMADLYQKLNTAEAGNRILRDKIFEADKLLKRITSLAGEFNIAAVPPPVEAHYPSRKPNSPTAAPKPFTRQVNNSAHRPAHNSPAKPEKPATVGDVTFNKTQQRILDALAWYESIGITEPTSLQVGAIALIDASGGHFSNTVGPLSSGGLIERGDGVIRLTDAGRAVAKLPARLNTLEEYHEMLRSRVRKARSATGKTVDVLDAIIAGGGAELSSEDVGAAVGIDHTGGHFSNTIGPLGTLGLIERKNGKVRPTELLFPEGVF